MSENKKAQEQAITLDIHYLKLLSRLFPTVAAASTEIINLEAILNLPKGTEHFLTDIHGEYEAFQHVLKNASGSIKRKVNDIFGNTLRESEKKALCTLIYYPQEKLQIVKEQEKDMNDWYLTTLNKLPERVVEIHALEGAQVVAGGVFLHHSGIAARNGRRSE